MGATLLTDDKDVQSSNRRYLLFTLAGIVLVLAGGFTDGAWQTGFWIAAVAVPHLQHPRCRRRRLAGAARALRRTPRSDRHRRPRRSHRGHRGAGGRDPVRGRGFDGNLVAAMTASGLLAGMLWWSYFDRPLPALEHRHEQLTDANERSRFARDVYTYNHFFIVGAILVMAAALEEIMLHPADPLPDAFRWMLFIGISGYLLGVVMSIVRAYSNLGRRTPGSRGGPGRPDRSHRLVGRRVAADRGRRAPTGDPRRRALPSRSRQPADPRVG